MIFLNLFTILSNSIVNYTNTHYGITIIVSRLQLVEATLTKPLWKQKQKKWQ